MKNKGMNRCRSFVIGLCVLCLAAALLAGCGGKQVKKSRFVGKWNATSAEMSGMKFNIKDLMDEFSMELKENGTCKMNIDDESETGTWEETDTGVKIKDSTETMDMTDKDGKLYVEYEGVSFWFEKE